MRITINVLPKFAHKRQYNNIPALMRIMALCQPSDKPLAEPMMVIYWRIYASLDLNELTTVKKYPHHESSQNNKQYPGTIIPAFYGIYAGRELAYTGKESGECILYYVIDYARIPWFNLISFLKRLLLWFHVADTTMKLTFLNTISITNFTDWAEYMEMNR